MTVLRKTTKSDSIYNFTRIAMEVSFIFTMNQLAALSLRPESIYHHLKFSAFRFPFECVNGPDGKVPDVCRSHNKENQQLQRRQSMLSPEGSDEAGLSSLSMSGTDIGRDEVADTDLRTSQVYGLVN